METSGQLTKSDFLKFLEAPMHLWAAKHDRLEITPSPLDVHIMNQGYQVERLAHSYLQSTLAGSPYSKLLWQASFSLDNYTIRTDALVEKQPAGAYDLYEIKSGTSVRPENILDAAFQYVILSKQQPMDRVFILHLNKQYIRAGELDIAQLFIAEDITQDVIEQAQYVEDVLPLAWEVAQSTSSIAIARCFSPKTCPCPSLCHPNLSENSIFNIPRLSAKKKNQLLKANIHIIQEIPPDFELSEKQRRIVDVVSTNTEFIDREAIHDEFQRFQFPLFFLDYETCLTAIPLYPGYHPQQQMVFQYSLHRMNTPNDRPIHTDYLADTTGDPSLELLPRLREDIGNNGTIFAWNKSFEMACHNDLAVIHPEYADFLADLNDRMYDLGDFISKGMYLHPKFYGSWSIKNVLPVMAPDLSYDHLAVNKGDQASVVWWDMIHSNSSDDEKESTKSALLAYCEMDTLAMVKIWQKLRGFF